MAFAPIGHMAQALDDYRRRLLDEEEVARVERSLSIFTDDERSFAARVLSFPPRLRQPPRERVFYSAAWTGRP